MSILSTSLIPIHFFQHSKAHRWLHTRHSYWGREAHPFPAQRSPCGSFLTLVLFPLHVLFFFIISFTHSSKDLNFWWLTLHLIVLALIIQNVCTKNRQVYKSLFYLTYWGVLIKTLDGFCNLLQKYSLCSCECSNCWIKKLQWWSWINKF